MPGPQIDNPREKFVYDLAMFIQKQLGHEGITFHEHRIINHIVETLIIKILRDLKTETFIAKLVCHVKPGLAHQSAP